MKAPYKLLAIALITLTLSCCRRDDDQPMQYHTLLLPQEVKDYLLFKPGTYWVYQNSKTMELDSVYVTEVDTAMYNILDEDNDISMDYQNLYVKTFSSFDEYYSIYHFKVPFPTNAIKDDYKYSIRKTRTKPGDYVGETVFLVSPIKLGQVAFLYSPSGIEKKLILEEIVPTYAQNNNTYHNVLLYDNEEDITYGRVNVKYYIASGVGIVKKVFTATSEEWDLIRYHIKK